MELVRDFLTANLGGKGNCTRGSLHLYDNLKDCFIYLPHYVAWRCLSLIRVKAATSAFDFVKLGEYLGVLGCVLSDAEQHSTAHVWCHHYSSPGQLVLEHASRVRRQKFHFIESSNCLSACLHNNDAVVLLLWSCVIIDALRRRSTYLLISVTVSSSFTFYRLFNWHVLEECTWPDLF